MTKKQNKEEMEIINFLGHKTCLIADPNTITKSTIRKMLMKYGMKNDAIKFPENYTDAENYVQGFTCDIVFSAYHFGKGAGTDLLDIHVKKRPNRLHSLFGMICEAETPAIRSLMVEKDVDFCLVTPYTYVDLEQLFIAAVKKKVNASPYEMAIAEGREHIESDSFDMALDCFERAAREDSAPDLAFYYQGVVHKKMQNDNLAKRAFLDGAEINPNSYRCLSALLLIQIEQRNYPEAYMLAKKIAFNFPLNPRLIPQFTRIFIITNNYEDIIKLAAEFKKFSKLESPHLCSYMAAGLATSAKFFTKNRQTELAQKTLRLAVEFAGENIDILFSIVLSLAEIGEGALADTVLSRVPIEFKDDPRFKIMDFVVSNQFSPAAKVLVLGRNLLTRNIKHPLVYEILLQRSIQDNRRKDAIDELYDDACHSFPDDIANFKKIIDKT